MKNQNSAPACGVRHDGVFLDGVAPLLDLGVVRVSGADAASFLHAQLTQDFLHLAPDQAHLTAHLSPRGRMQASFIALHGGRDDFLLLCRRDLLEAALRRLRMYVLRSKVQLEDVSAAYRLHGLAGSAVQRLAGDGAAMPWSASGTVQDGCLVHLYPAHGQRRALLLALADATPPGLAQMAVLSGDLWQWGEVQGGVATLCAAVADMFVPQMLNYESVDGVNFKKGCYPGQEVVARSQFRGSIKRRTFPVSCGEGEPPPPATPVQARLAGADAPQECGVIVQSAVSPHGGWVALACLQLSALEPDGGAVLYRDGFEAQSLTVHALPYPLREDL